ISLVALVLGYGLFKVRVWAFYLFVANAIYSVVHALYQLNLAHSAGETNRIVIGLFSVLFTATIMGYFIRKHVRAPYFNPRLRWWESAPRFQLETAVELSHTEPTDETVRKGFPVTGRLSDISIGGAFVVTDAKFDLGEMLICNFRLGNEHIETPG